MNSAERIVWLLLLLAIAATGGLLLFSHGLTGAAVAGFTSSAQVVRVVFDTAHGQNETPAIANGANVRLAVPASYPGAGEQLVTVGIPAGLENGSNWQFFENGQAKNLSLLGSNLLLRLNLTHGSGVLHVDVLAPFMNADPPDLQPQSYSQVVRIGAEAYFPSVAASIPAASNFMVYRLYEIIGSQSQDVSALYHFSYDGGNASWSGFSVGSRVFRIVASNGSETPARAGSGGGASYTIPPIENATIGNASETTNGTPTNMTPGELEYFGVQSAIPGYFRIIPSWIDASIASDESQGQIITIYNPTNKTREFSIITTAPFLHAPAEFSLGPYQHIRLAIGIGPAAAGMHEGRLIVTDGAFEQQVFFNVASAGAAPSGSQNQALEPGAPATQQPAAITQALPYLLGLSFALSVTLAICLVIMIGRRPGVRSPKPARSHPEMPGRKERAIAADEPMLPAAARKDPAPEAAGWNIAAPPDKPFYLQSGEALLDLDMLRSALRTMSDATFAHHVNAERHDFSVWAGDALSSPELAQRMTAARTRQELLEILEHRTDVPKE